MEGVTNFEAIDFEARDCKVKFTIRFCCWLNYDDDKTFLWKKKKVRGEKEREGGGVCVVRLRVRGTPFVTVQWP